MESKSPLFVKRNASDGLVAELAVSPRAVTEPTEPAAIIGRLEPVRVERLAGALARFTVDLSKP
jgi:hypothetical protein